MKNIKKTLVMCISLVLIAALAIGGTVAYLTVDPVEKSNIFTVGDIAIQLDEDVAVHGAGTVEKTDDGATYTGVMPGDYLKKEVSVKNTGSRPAYVAVEVTFNNALAINKAIDEVYEGKEYTEAQIQAIYDYIFDGFGLNYTKTDASGNALGMRLTITGDDMPEGVMQVDSVKTITDYVQSYNGNWFAEGETVNYGDGFKGYYSTGMDEYQIRYTYYMLLDPEQIVTLFKGFNVPASFNAAQLEMFENMNIDIVATAIQADNFTDAQSAFTALKREYEDGVNDGDIGAPELQLVSNAADLAKAFEQGGLIELTDDIELTEALNVAAGKSVMLNLNGKSITSGSDGYVLNNENGGTLTIDGEGTLTGVVYTGDGSKTVINGGTYNAVEGGKYVLLNSSGSLTVNGGEVNGGSSYPVYSYDNGHELVINDITVNGKFGCISAYSKGNITVNGGEFYMTGVQGITSHIAYIYGNTNMTINDGTFEKIGNISMSGTGGGGIGSAGNAVITINGGNFKGDYRDLYVWSTTSKIIVKGGTYAFNPTSEGAKIADGYLATKNDDGTYTVGRTKAASAADIDAAITNGEKVELTNDVAFSSNISNDADIDLNGNTLEATYSYYLSNNADLTITDGDYVVNNTYGHVDVRPTTADGSVVTFENVDFSFNKLNKTYGPSTNRLGSVLEFCADAEGGKAVIVFKNCTFDNAQVVLEGMSGKTGEVDITFENCTFNALTSSAPIYVQNYVKGVINVIGCTFNLECTSSTASAIYVSSSTSTSVTVNAQNNTINAVAATPYTYDASKGETEVHNVKVNGTPANIKFIFSYANCTVNETGTVKTGIAK